MKSVQSHPSAALLGVANKPPLTWELPQPKRPIALKVATVLDGKGEPVPDSVLFGVENGVRILEAGFTTVQSLGPGTAWDLALREAWARNLVPGPRLLTSLQWFRYDQPGQTMQPEPELRAMVRD